MTKLFISVSLFLFIISFGTRFIYDKFNNLRFDISHLKNKNKVLSKKNKSLQKKQSNIKKKVKARKTTLLSRKLNRAKTKLAKAPISMVPFMGAVVIVGFTAYEIRNYCEDIKDYKKFEESLFGVFDNTITEDEKLLCGLNTEDILLPELNKYKNLSTDWITQYYNSLTNDIKIQFNSIVSD